MKTAKEERTNQMWQDQKREIAELRRIRDKHREELKNIEATNVKLNHIRLAQYEMMKIERDDLLVRVARLNVRMKALGLQNNANGYNFRFDEETRKWMRSDGSEE